ncbi:minor tail protein [Mycobacterium phage Phillis]|nr:minor tail protein [Mycobacterium phage Phillis]
MTAVIEWAGVALGPAGVLAGVLGKGWFDRRTVATKNPSEETKLDAEAAQIIANTAVALVAPLKTEINELSTRVTTLETENQATTSKLQLAVNHIRTLYSWIYSHIPDKTPPQPPSELGI